MCPIIKSRTRKDRNTHQMVQYLFHESEVVNSFTVLHNLDTDPNPTAIANALGRNAQYLKRRKSGISFYHDIISFSPSEQDANFLRANPHVLYEFARTYLVLRAPNSLGVAKAHVHDKKNVHIHFIISANQVGDSRSSSRLTKQQFQNIKKAMDLFQKQKYPELVHTYTHTIQEKKTEHSPLNRSIQLDRSWEHEL